MRRLALYVCAGALLEGCAVLTVDVDVYKGPLINNERTRGEQVAAMAIGARPLLLQLRSDFESRCSDRRTGEAKSRFTADERCIEIAAIEKTCSVQLMQPKQIPEGCLRSWRARRVNAVVGLYEKRPSNAQPTSLSDGRREEGLDILVEQYFDAEKTAPSRVEAAGTPDARNAPDRARDELLAALLDFGQKVVYLANFELLLPDSGFIESVPGIRSLFGGDRQVDQNARLLQAVGNSILNQVHDKKHWDEYRYEQHRTKGWRLQAHRRAELAFQDVAWASVSSEIKGDQTVDEADRTAALAGLSAGRQSLGETTAVLARLKASAEEDWRKAQAEAAKFASMAAALESSKVARRMKAMKFKTSQEVAVQVRAMLNEPDMARVAGAGTLRTSLDDVLARSSIGADASGEKTYAALRESVVQLSADKKKTADEAKARYAARARWADAVSVAAAPPSAFPYPGGGDNLRDANEVLDRMIASLQEQHVLEIQSGLEERARATASALRLAQQYRADGIFIRHSAVFLRDNYPATVLQKDQEDQNLLLNRASAFGTTTESSVITNTIDKQFWQTVNHISLSAAGNSTYVVTKDDVGNWYVKGYSASPDAIYKSAANMALYAASSRMPGNVLPQKVDDRTPLLKAATSPAAPATGGAPAPEVGRPVLERQLDVATTGYETDLRNAFAAARDLATSAPEALRIAGKKAVRDAAKPMVDSIIASVQAPNVPAQREDPKTLDPARALSLIVETGRELLAYRLRAIDGIEAHSKELGDDAPKLREALRTASADVMRRLLAKADQAAAAFDSKLTFMEQTLATAQ